MKIETCIYDKEIGHQLDITAPQAVEIVVSFDDKTIWINIDGICKLRVCQIEHLELIGVGREMEK